MSDPTTPTGKRLAADLLIVGPDVSPDIIAIEQEAAAAERERLDAMVESEMFDRDAQEYGFREALRRLFADPKEYYRARQS